MPTNAREHRQAFFFIADRGTEGWKGYPHSAVVLAEGLRRLGWTITSNIQAWQQHPGGEFLFPGNPIEATEAADLIVFEEDFFYLGGSDQLPDLSRNVRAPKVFVDRSDLVTADQNHSAHPGFIHGKSFRQLDLILRCHSSSFLRYPSNVQPTVFGISDRIHTAAEEAAGEKSDFAVWNFRHSNFPHSTRLWADRHVKPLIAAHLPLSALHNKDPEADTPYAQLMLRQTSGRHFTSYYRELGRALLCPCFGGWFLLPVPQRELSPFNLRTRGLVTRLKISSAAIAQWDSWRLWEAFASGVAVMHFDFAHHRFLTGGPPPQPLKHYVPVSVSNPRKSLEPVLDDHDLLRRIGLAGKAWAEEHYNSVALAKRMLDHLGMRNTPAAP